MAGERKHARGVERERKFLVRELPSGLHRHRHQEIDQGYVAIADRDRGGTEVRLRRTGGRAVLTVKRGRGAIRQEIEVPLPPASADALWPLTRGRRLRKVRYTIPHRGVDIQLDVYRGALRGLAIAEVELTAARALRRFQPPQWLGKEVTGYAAYSNSRLAAGRKPALRGRGRHGI